MTEETVTIKVLADTSQFSKEMRNASKQTGRFTAETKKQSAITSKGWKNFAKSFGGGFKSTFSGMASSMGGIASAMSKSMGKVAKGVSTAMKGATAGMTAGVAGAVVALVGLIAVVAVALIKELIKVTGKYTKMFDPAMYEKQMNKVNASLQKVSTSLGAVLMPVFIGLTEYVSMVMDNLNAIIEGIVTVYGYIVGILGITDAISRNATEYSEAMEDASAVANEGLASFDKLNTFNTEGMGNEQQAQRIRDIMADAAQNGLNLREQLGQVLDPMRLIGNFFASLNLTEPWLKFQEAGAKAWEAVVTGAKDAWDTVSNIVQTVWEKAFSTITSIWNNILPVAQEVLGNIGERLRQGVSIVINYVTTAFTGVFQIIGGDFETGIQTIFNNVKDTLHNVVEFISNTLGSVVGTVVDKFTSSWKSAFDTVKNLWNNLTSTMSSILDSVKNGVETAFKDISGKVGKIFGGIFDNVSTAILSGFKKTMGVVVDFLNTFIDAYNNTLGNLNINGVGFGKLEKLSVPALAQGGVARPNDPFLAVVGDNKTEEEIIAPKSVIEEAVRNVVGDTSQPIQVDVILDGRKIARAMFDYLDGEAKRRGTGIGWH